jgi:hypothetical protein
MCISIRCLDSVETASYIWQVIAIVSGNPEKLIGLAVAIEPAQVMSCLADCPLSYDGDGPPACDKGPLVYGRVWDVNKEDPELARVMVERLGYVCTRGGGTRFVAEQDLGPAPQSQKRVDSIRSGAFNYRE